MLGEIIASCGWPKGAVSVVPCNTRLAEAMVADDRFRMLSFTGSPEVGWRLKEMAGRKRVALELGGNAATVVDETADVAYAATRCVTGAFAFSGQVCISVQRILVHEAVFEEFSQRFIQELSKLRFGDPMDEATDLGPMISEGAARRCEEWVEEAVKGGAKVLAGGKRERNFFQPTVLTGTMPEMKVNACEVFAPVVTLEPFSDFDKALAAANDGPYGLQAGVFTNDGRRIMRAFRGLDVGGVIVNDIPTLRLDHMPYGGVKLSGMGREGVRPAIEEMTEMRLLALNLG
jgi:glyceraldehyde-3-phosphate dehydrogenase (NADP+)